MMLFRQDITGCLGPGRGIDKAEYERALAALPPVLDHLRQQRTDGSLALLSCPARVDDLPMLESVAADIRAGYGDVVVLGTGGSSLGARCLCALRAPADRGPGLHFPDNLDAFDFAALLSRLDFRTTLFLVVSKSGGTAETLAQTLTAMAAMKKAGISAFDKHFTVITQPGDSPLQRLATGHGMPVLDHDPGLGGRYSVLSLVGLLPAMIAGLDGAAARRGAARVVDDCLNDDSGPGSAVAEGAALMHAFARGGGRASVMWPYCGRLAPFAAWWRQLWAESLGKDGQGTLPVAALGPVDQHSQLQLYLDGPNETLLNVITIPRPAGGAAFDLELAADEAALDYLRGHDIGDLVVAEGRATADALAAAGRPVRRLAIGRLDEEALGALLMHFMLETILCAALMGIDAFDQPAVEQAKILTRRYLAGERDTPP